MVATVCSGLASADDEVQRSYTSLPMRTTACMGRFVAVDDRLEIEEAEAIAREKLRQRAPVKNNQPGL